jgi:sulfonate transport system substrate-binding protein
MEPTRLTRRHVLAGATALALLPRPGHAAEAAPKVIRLAGQGAGYGKDAGLQVLGELQARQYLEKAFAADGTRIEWTYPAGTGPAINEKLANNQVDFANYGGLPNIVGRATGLPTKILASYGVQNLYVAVRNGVKADSIRDLTGLKIAVSRGTINHLSMARVLADNGLGEKDFQVFDLKAADQATAITTGDIDAAFGSSNLLGLESQGVARILYSTREKLSPAAFFGSFVVTEDFAGRYPGAVQRVVDNFVQAAHWASLEENRAAVIDAWQQSGAPRATIEADLKGQTLKLRNTPLIDDFYLGQLNAGIAWAHDNKLIRRPIDVNGWIDRHYLDNAIATAGLQGFWQPRDAGGNLRG